ncbi:MAG: hypothetical protein M3046_14470, partial [Actinomycetota bacterium]|nr:hypothetical protein [Actinomycetota bacterium]
AQETAAFEELAGKRLVALEDALREQFRALRSELVDEAHRIEHTAAERLEQARSLVTSATGRIEQAAASPDNRRVADVQPAAFDKVAGQWALELREAVREHIEVLDELNGLHASASEQLDVARALTAGALRSGTEALRSMTLPTRGDKPERSPIHWTAPPGLTPFPGGR